MKFQAMEQTFYEKFGITQTASEEDIKTAYRWLAKKYHPDLHDGSSEYDQIFKEINLIYEVLSDKQKRAEYDSMLSQPESDLEFIHNAYYTEHGIYATTDPLRPIWNNIYTDEETGKPSPSFRSTLIAWVIRILIFGLLMWYAISRNLSHY